MKKVLVFLLLTLLIAVSQTHTDEVKLFEEGVKLYEQQDLQGAKEMWLKVLAINPMNADTLLNLGVVEAQLGNYSQSAVYLEKARTIHPEWEQIYYYLGNVYSLEKDYKKAKEIYEKGLKVNPASERLQANLGYACLMLEDFEVSYSFCFIFSSFL